jgi:hypothetical protein
VLIVERARAAGGFGLELPLGRLLVVGWAPRAYQEHARFVFDGGTLTDEQLDAIELPFASSPRARAAGATWYLEHGVPLDC